MAADHVRGAREAPGGSCEAANRGVFFAQIAEVLEGGLLFATDAKRGASRASMRLLLHLQIPHVMPRLKPDLYIWVEKVNKNVFVFSCEAGAKKISADIHPPTGGTGGARTCRTTTRSGCIRSLH